MPYGSLYGQFGGITVSDGMMITLIALYIIVIIITATIIIVLEKRSKNDYKYRFPYYKPFGIHNLRNIPGQEGVGGKKGYNKYTTFRKDFRIF